MSNSGYRVKLLRQNRSWSTAQLAERSGIEEYTVIELERDGQSNVQVLRKLAVALDCELSWLITGNRGKSPPSSPRAITDEVRPTATSGSAISGLVRTIRALHPSREELDELKMYFETLAQKEFELESKKQP